MITKMKTKLTPSLAYLIKKGKFDYVNSDITVGNFPKPKSLRTDYKLYHFDRDISSKGAIKQMEKDGYTPADVYELLSWEGWKGNDLVVSLGSVATVDGPRGVAYLDGHGSGRELGLDWFDDDWYADCRFLAVRNSDTKTLSPLPSETLSLSDIEVRVKGKVYKLTEK